MYKINEHIELNVPRSESDFDKACDEAHHFALIKFEVDGCGHINNVIGADRSSCSIVLEFKKYQLFCGMGGSTHYYSFEAWVEKAEEDED